MTRLWEDPKGMCTNIKLSSYFYVAIYVAGFSKTLDIDIKIQDLGGQDQVLVLVSTKYSNQDKSWSQTRLFASQN